MGPNGTGRTPRQVYGHSGTATTESVRVWVASGPSVTLAVWQMWERAARTDYAPGEPLQLTQVRDELELARDVSRELYKQGYPPILAAHVVNALKLAGWVR